jgi:hypothetical protein
MHSHIHAFTWPPPPPTHTPSTHTTLMRTHSRALHNALACPHTYEPHAAGHTRMFVQSTLMYPLTNSLSGPRAKSGKDVKTKVELQGSLTHFTSVQQFFWDLLMLSDFLLQCSFSKLDMCAHLVFLLPDLHTNTKQFYKFLQHTSIQYTSQTSSPCDIFIPICKQICIYEWKTNVWERSYIVIVLFERGFIGEALSMETIIVL